MIKIPNFKSKILKLWQKSKEEAEELRLAIGTHPKVVMWRLHIFGWSPFISKNILEIVAVLIVIFTFTFSLYLFEWRAPRPFPDHVLITVERGESLSKIVSSLEENNVVRSRLWLRFFVTVMGGENKVIAGDYYFPNPKNVIRVAWMLHQGKYGLISEKVTIPEGLSSYEIADLLDEKLPAFDANEFLSLVDDGGYEGYLFPDTYFFLPNTKAGDVVLTMRENFARQIAVYQADIDKLGKPLSEIVIMASIIEDESNSSLNEKRIVSGILWKRISLEMPMQVDAPFKYYNGKHSFTLTKDDLAEDHPYNTYINKGLPPTAIANPGVDSLRAAIAPTASDYLFFLSDRYGNMHYARDFEGHKRNRELYLN